MVIALFLEEKDGTTADCCGGNYGMLEPQTQRGKRQPGKGECGWGLKKPRNRKNSVDVGGRQRTQTGGGNSTHDEKSK